MAEISTQRLHPEAVLEYWPYIKPALDKGLEHGAQETTTYQWFQYLTNNPDDHHLWVVFMDGAPVNITMTKFNYYETHLALHVVLTAAVGDAKWKDYVQEAYGPIEDFARYHNCRRLEQWGRDGWLRVLPKLKGQNGEVYKKTYTVMSMELDYS